MAKTDYSILIIALLLIAGYSIFMGTPLNSGMNGAVTGVQNSGVQSSNGSGGGGGAVPVADVPVTTDEPLFVPQVEIPFIPIYMPTNCNSDGVLVGSAWAVDSYSAMGGHKIDCGTTRGTSCAYNAPKEFVYSGSVSKSDMFCCVYDKKCYLPEMR